MCSGAEGGGGGGLVGYCTTYVGLCTWDGDYRKYSIEQLDIIF